MIRVDNYTLLVLNFQTSFMSTNINQVMKSK